MSILYILSSILIIILFILLKKTDEKKEIVKNIIIAIVLKIAFNTAICYIFNFINIPITLLSLSLIDFSVSIILLIIIIKNKQIQKYSFSITNFVATIAIAATAIVILNINFGNFTKIRYISMDSREHYKAAREFSENTMLRSKIKEVTETRVDHMLVGYTNVGILFKVFEPYIGTIQLYKVYIIAEAAIYALTGIMFFLLLEKHLKNIKLKIIAIIFSIIYILGYPLNAWITGFHYLIFGILFLETIFYLFENVFNKKGKTSINVILLLLCNFGLMFSYALFCPFVYLAEFIYLIYKFKKDKNKKETIIYILFTLLIPGIAGVLYIIVPLFNQMSGFISQDGWTYKNLWSNFILFVPFSIYAIYKSIRRKEFTFDKILFIVLIVYMLALFVGVKLEKVSIYYFYKNFFVLWIMLVYFNAKGMIEVIESDKLKAVIAYTCIMIYIFILVIYGCNKKAYIEDERTDSFENIMQIFVFNKTMIEVSDEMAFVNRGEIDLYTNLDININANLKNKKETIIITNPNEEQWLESMTGYNYKVRDYSDEIIERLQKDEYKYLCVFEKTGTYKQVEQYINKNNLKVLYENEVGKIYEKEN